MIDKNLFIFPAFLPCEIYINYIRKNLKLLNAILFIITIAATQYLHAQYPTNACKIRLPQSVNSFQPTILPVLSIDGHTLFFDRKLHPDNIASTKDLDDIWYSQKTSDNTFEPAQNLGTEYNTNGSDVIFSITPDGKALIYGTRQGQKAGFSIAKFDGQKLKNFTPLKIDNYYNKAKNFFAFLSADSRTLLLSIQTSKSHGELDLYVSFKKNDKYEYTEPMNLGAIINTKKTEGSPFLAYDNKTLYFSSNGRKGFGGKDLFMTKRLDDTWTNWSEPINLGNTINSQHDDNGIVLTALGDSAIVSSWDTTSKREGLYYICLPQKLQPEPYIIVTGRVKGKNIKLTNFKNVEIEVKYDANNLVDRYKPLYGDRFYFVLQRDLFAPIVVKKTGFDDFGFSVNSHNLRKSKFVSYNTALDKKRPKRLLLGTIYFDFGSYKLNKEAKKQLSKILDKIIEPEETQLIIVGHTDEKGSEQYNLELSQKRAETLKSELVKFHLEPYLIRIEAKGETEPASKIDEKNRRVEIYLLDD